MIAETRNSAGPVTTRQDGAGRAAGVLGALFPVPAATMRMTPRWLHVAVQSTAAGLATAVLLLRIPGVPSWDALFAEDYWEFLVPALQHPWRLFVPYAGYEQLLQRMVAQFVTYLPLADAAAAFAVCGALIAAGCALFVFHASAGHIRHVTLRVLLGAAVVLLPIAPMEIADSTVNASWYLLLAMFWAAVWRPRTRAAMAVAVVVAFTTAASESLAALFLPLLVLRLLALPRLREHAVTAGWLAGCLVQLPVIIVSYTQGQSRLDYLRPLTGHSSTLGNSLTFYAHGVVLRSIGWDLSWRLASRTGTDLATVLVAALLLASFGVIMAGYAGAQQFVIAAVLTGFIFSVFSTTMTPWLATEPVYKTWEPGARYTALPTFLVVAALIVGADHLRRSWRAQLVRPVLVSVTLTAVLAAGWVTDFRYPGIRIVPASQRWSLVVARWHRACSDSASGEITEWVGSWKDTIPCHRINW
jgi:hypothetical protein